MASSIGEHSRPAKPSQSKGWRLVPEAEYLGPMFDGRVEPDAQDMIVARELLAIYDGALDEKSRRR